MFSTYYAGLHVILETFSILISLMIFLVYWNTHEKDQNLSTVILGYVFLSVGLFDMMHKLSAKGMPDFFSPSSIEKGIFFWLFARIIESIGLCAAVFLGRRQAHFHRSTLAIASVLSFFFLISIWGTYYLDYFPRTFDENGLTPFKKSIEYGVLLVHLIIVTRLYLQTEKKEEHHVQLIKASVFIFASEICFTLYSSNGDLYNFFGHVLKNVAYFHIYKSILVQGLYLPYKKLQQSQKEVLWSQERMRIIVQEMPVMVVAIGSDRIVTVWNKECERVTGYTSLEICNQPKALEKIIPDVQYRKEVIRELSKNQFDLRNFSINIVAKDGSTKTISWSSIAGIYPISGWTYWGTGIDQTERHDLEKQLWQSQKMEALGQLAGGVAHDINNMLTIISASAQVLMRNADKHDPEKTKKNTNSIIKNVERATTYLKQLLSFSRKQVGRPSELVLNEEIQELRTMLDPLLGSGIQLHMNFSAVDYHFMAEKSQLEQIILNLAVNAKDAMSGHGQIWIETGHEAVQQTQKIRGLTLKPGTYALLKVRDSGSGIPKDIQDRIFEPFFTTKEKGKGTGLGLSTVFGIVRSLNGIIDLISSPENGTEFKIYIPLISEVNHFAQDDRPESEPQIVEHRQPRILIAEDDIEIQNVLCDYILDLGAEVFKANNGLEGLEKLDPRDMPDLIITDIMMPKMNGLDLVKKARELSPLQKIIFISGYADPSIVDEIHRMGTGVSFIDKPFTTEELEDAVLKFLPQLNKQKAA